MYPLFVVRVLPIDVPVQIRDIGLPGVHSVVTGVEVGDVEADVFDKICKLSLDEIKNGTKILKWVLSHEVGPNPPYQRNGPLRTARLSFSRGSFSCQKLKVGSLQAHSAT